MQPVDARVALLLIEAVRFVRLEPEVVWRELPRRKQGVLALGWRGDPSAVEAAHADRCVEPDRAVGRFMNCAHLVVAEPVGCRVVPHLIAVDAANALEMTAEPEVSAAVLQDRAHAAIDCAVFPRCIGERQEPWGDGLASSKDRRRKQGSDVGEDGGAEAQGVAVYASRDGRKRDVESTRCVRALALDAPRIDQARMVLQAETRSSQVWTSFERSVGSRVQRGLDAPAWRTGIGVVDPCRKLDAGFLCGAHVECFHDT